MGGPPALSGQSPGRPLRWMATSPRKGRTEPRLQAGSPSRITLEQETSHQVAVPRLHRSDTRASVEYSPCDSPRPRAVGNDNVSGPKQSENRRPASACSYRISDRYRRPRGDEGVSGSPTLTRTSTIHPLGPGPSPLTSSVGFHFVKFTSLIPKVCAISAGPTTPASRASGSTGSKSRACNARVEI